MDVSRISSEVFLTDSFGFLGNVDLFPLYSKKNQVPKSFRRNYHHHPTQFQNVSYSFSKNADKVCSGWNGVDFCKISGFEIPTEVGLIMFFKLKLFVRLVPTLSCLPMIDLTLGWFVDSGPTRRYGLLKRRPTIRTNDESIYRRYGTVTLLCGFLIGSLSKI